MPLRPTPFAINHNKQAQPCVHAKNNKRHSTAQRSTAHIPFSHPIPSTEQPILGTQYSKSSSTAGPLLFVTLSCFLYISTTCLELVAISGFLSSRILINLGNRKLIPFSPPPSRPSLHPALYLGLSVKSAVFTSQTTLGSNQTSGWCALPAECE